jgi:hypothetical protein
MAQLYLWNGALFPIDFTEDETYDELRFRMRDAG